jgi:hypothetical protein
VGFSNATRPYAARTLLFMLINTQNGVLRVPSSSAQLFILYIISAGMINDNEKKSAKKPVWEKNSAHQYSSVP